MLCASDWKSWSEVKEAPGSERLGMGGAGVGVPAAAAAAAFFSAASLRRRAAADSPAGGGLGTGGAPVVVSLAATPLMGSSVATSTSSPASAEGAEGAAGDATAVALGGAAAAAEAEGRVVGAALGDVPFRFSHASFSASYFSRMAHHTCMLACFFDDLSRRAHGPASALRRVICTRPTLEVLQVQPAGSMSFSKRREREKTCRQRAGDVWVGGWVWGRRARGSLARSRPIMQLDIVRPSRPLLWARAHLLLGLAHGAHLHAAVGEDDTPIVDHAAERGGRVPLVCKLDI